MGFGINEDVVNY